MSICIHRPETPGFWTPCRSCPCGKEVADAAVDAATAPETPASNAEGRQIEETEVWRA